MRQTWPGCGRNDTHSPERLRETADAVLDGLGYGCIADSAIVKFLINQ
jgi:hypothetical protein